MTNDERSPKSEIRNPKSDFELRTSGFGLRASPYDALLLVSFGGPEGPDEVMPFLEKVAAGKEIPPERLREIAGHYELFGGQSPINAQNRALLAALIAELNAHGPPLPVYWGNRHWHPLLADAVRQMAADGVRHALAFVTSAFGSYPGCRQYLEDIERARQQVGPDAPRIDKLRLFFNHPGFIEAAAERVGAAWGEVPAERRAAARLIFTAHSIPTAMAERSPYVAQLREACGLVVERIRHTPCASVCSSAFRRRDPPEGGTTSDGTRRVPDTLRADGTRRVPDTLTWDLVFQSRSGRAAQPWLEPDVRDHLRRLPQVGGVADVILAPIGFLVESMELVYDLDVEVRGLCEELGVNMVRVPAVGSHPRLIRLVRELILERLDRAAPRLALGTLGPWPDQCPGDCCR